MTKTVTLRLDSARPRELGRGVENPSGFLSLADLRADTAEEAADARLVTRRAVQEIAGSRERLRSLGNQRVRRILANLRVQAQNLAAASPYLPAGSGVWEAVQALSLRIQEEGRSALAAQNRPTRGSLLELLQDEPGNKPSRPP